MADHTYLNVLLLCMSKDIQTFNFIHQLVFEILQFKESCILIAPEVSGSELKNQLFLTYLVFAKSYRTNTFIFKQKQYA